MHNTCMGKDYYYTVTGNSEEAIKKRRDYFTKLSRGIAVEGTSDTITTHKRNYTIHTTFSEAPWGFVVAGALAAAFFINIAKLIIYDFTGTPEFQFADPELRFELEYLQEALK